MAINLASKASPKVVERFKVGSMTEGLFSNDYEWSGVATVRVYSVDTLPLNDYDKTKVDGTSRFGALTEVGDTIQEMTVKDDKSFNGIIDKGNDTAQLQIKAASKILKRETDEVLIPYVDKYRLKVLANGASQLVLSTTDLTKTNILDTIFAAGAAMSNKLVPLAGRVVYIGETLAVKLKLSDQVVGLEKAGQAAVVNGVCGTIGGMQVRIVPDVYLPAGVNFMIVKKGVACAPKKIETFRVLENQYIVDGHIAQGRMLHDCFVLGSKADGIYVHAKSGALTAPTITIASNQATIASPSSETGTTIKYTLDGSDPKTSPTAATYSDKVTVTAGAKVRAFASKAGSLNSGIAEATA